MPLKLGLQTLRSDTRTPRLNIRHIGHQRETLQCYPRARVTCTILPLSAGTLVMYIAYLYLIIYKHRLIKKLLEFLPSANVNYGSGPLIDCNYNYYFINPNRRFRRPVLSCVLDNQYVTK